MNMSAAEMVALVRKAAAASLNAQAEVAQEATRDLAPKDSLALVESIKVTDATERDLTAQVYSNADHAVFQHEALDIAHPTGQSKYMEAAIAAEAGAIQRAGAAAARKALGG